MMTTYRHYTPYAIQDILRTRFPMFVKKDGNYIMNEAISFDIEVTSTYHNEQKIAFMYEWTLDIFDCAIVGRTWIDFIEVCNQISRYFNLSGIKRRCIIYVHNLAYEFAFFRKLFQWVKVFSLSKRKPLYALTTSGIEFRCSYRLSGYKLEKVGEQVGIEKLTEDFDYTKIRHSSTPLTPKEIQYCVHDVKIVTQYIKQKIAEENNNISEIPLTKTGYVRRYVRNHTLRGLNRCFYKNAISTLTIEPHEYTIAKQAFTGGFTHASILHAERLMDDVTSFDISSSYPTVLIAEKFPMTKGELIESPTFEEFTQLVEDDDIACIFTIELKDIKKIFPCESYISHSRCLSIINSRTHNGRVLAADSAIITMTDIDYQIIKRVYKFTPTRIGNLYIYRKFYLPTEFVKCILHFYNIKTTLKDIPEKLTEYMNGKENLNSIYGMTVTDIVRELIEYDNKGGWVNKEKRTDEEYEEFLSNQLDKENNKKSRFLFYLWGVFTTAYARRNLWNAIFECTSDYIYSDTDSVKIINASKHESYFRKYNEEITEKLESALQYHNLPLSLLHPKNIHGEEKPLGIWDFDGHYKHFKAVRAKSYMYQSDDLSYHMVVAGLNKNSAMKYIMTQTDNPFDFFEYGMKIPATYINPETGETESGTGKLTHTYIDEPFRVQIVDYKHQTAWVSEQSYVHLENAAYELSLAQVIKDKMKNVEFNVYE